MASEAARTHPAGIPPWRIAIALSAGILLWMVHLVGQATLVDGSCSEGLTWALHALTVVTAVPTLAAAGLGVRIVRAAGDDAGAVGTRLLGWLAVVMNVTSLVLIVAEWLPVLVIDACAVG